jgi:hypothetical protein
MFRKTSHLKLLNAISQSVANLGLPKDDELSAYRFHLDLSLSGFERIILVRDVKNIIYLR